MIMLGDPAKSLLPTAGNWVPNKSLLPTAGSWAAFSFSP